LSVGEQELLQMCADIDTGKVEMSPFTEDFFDRLKDLVEDVELDDGPLDELAQ